MQNPKNTPNKGPPIEVRIKLNKTFVTVAELPFAKSKNRAKNTIAVPSFNKDSPSTSVLKRTLAPSYFNSATTATGSVADNTHPNVNA